MRKENPRILLEGWLIEYDKPYNLNAGEKFAKGSLGVPGTSCWMPVLKWIEHSMDIRFPRIGDAHLFFKKKGVYFKCYIPANKGKLFTDWTLDTFRNPAVTLSISGIETDKKNIITNGKIFQVVLIDEDNYNPYIRVSRVTKVQIIGT